MKVAILFLLMNVSAVPFFLFIRLGKNIFVASGYPYLPDYPFFRPSREIFLSLVRDEFFSREAYFQGCLRRSGF